MSSIGSEDASASVEPADSGASAASAVTVAVIVAAKDEADRIASTVAAARRIVGVDLVVVVDDGSTDDTARLATQAGAMVVSHSRNRGKAAAMATGARAVAELGRKGPHGSGAPELLLFVDADLEESAANLAVLIPPVASGQADMTIAILPPQKVAGGGHGFVVRLARDGIRGLTGWTSTQPLSGMRCVSREAFEAATPLAPGWGVEVGLTIDVLGAGMRVLEVPCDLQHRVTGSDWRGQVHRARQYRDVWLALAARRARALPVVRRARALPAVQRVRALPVVQRVRALPVVRRAGALPVVQRVRGLRVGRGPRPPARTRDRD